MESSDATRRVNLRPGRGRRAAAERPDGPTGRESKMYFVGEEEIDANSDAFSQWLMNLAYDDY